MVLDCDVSSGTYPVVVSCPRPSIPTEVYTYMNDQYMQIHPQQSICWKYLVIARHFISDI